MDTALFWGCPGEEPQTRESALSALGVLKRDVPVLLAGVPSSEEHFFRGQFAAILQHELDSRKQVAEIAKRRRGFLISVGLCKHRLRLWF